MNKGTVREIPRDDCAMADDKKYTLSSFFNSSVKVTDCRIPYGMVYTKENLNRLKEKKIIRGKETIQDFQRTLYRLLLNPTPQLQAMINSFKQKYYTKKNVFAIQIRMGGYISDIPERTEMMSLTELEKLPKAIKDAMASLNFSAANTVLFLSTDSSFAERYIQQKMGNLYTFVTNNAFHRGHTTGTPDGVTVQRAITDLFLLADSDVLFIGHGSRFGYVARIMGRAKRVIEYKATQYIMSDFNETK